MAKVKLNELREFCIQVLLSVGMDKEDSVLTADTLTVTDSFGVLTHGTKNLYQYILKMEAGGLEAKAKPEVICEGPAWAIIDGNKAIGMVTASKAMKLAIKKAKNTGIAYVGVKNSCHFGAAGYYSNIAAEEGMIGLSMSNADPVIAVPNGCKKAIGSNPFSFAAPTGDGRSVFLDIALSSVAALKVITAQEKGQKIPDTWLVDENGIPTDDASKFPANASLQPMAAHKGYGLAVLVELLSAVITGAGMLSEIKSWNLDLASVNNAGHAFIVIDVSKMMPYEQVLERMSLLSDELKNAPKAINSDRIYLPGEMEWDKRIAAQKDGMLEITDAMEESYQKLSELTGIKINLY